MLAMTTCLDLMDKRWDELRQDPANVGVSWFPPRDSVPPAHTNV
jgi:hypothetical protein